MVIDYAHAQMVSQQVRTWDVLDERVLDAMREVPRAQFVPERYRALAYADAQIPLAHGQHMLRSMVVGRMLQTLEVAPGDRVLEVGAGSGYVTACLGRLAGNVRSLEIFADLADEARANLRACGSANVEVVTADAMALEERSQYDVIAVTGSLPLYDERFGRALRPGGRLFVVVGEPPVMEAMLVRRAGEAAFGREILFETVIDPLINAPCGPRFNF